MVEANTGGEREEEELKYDRRRLRSLKKLRRESNKKKEEGKR